MTSTTPGLRERAAQFALLPPRLFLGVTFVYAGLDKLTDSAFLRAAGDGSIGQQMEAVRDAAALPGLVDLALDAPVAFGTAIALGELAAGLGILAGLLGRLSAAGGALISLSLWLTVSWSVTPYYFGNDLVYLVAWLPLVLAGTPGLSLDALIARSRRDGRERHGRQSPQDRQGRQERQNQRDRQRQLWPRSAAVTSPEGTAPSSGAGRSGNSSARMESSTGGAGRGGFGITAASEWPPQP